MSIEKISKFKLFWDDLKKECGLCQQQTISLEHGLLIPIIHWFISFVCKLNYIMWLKSLMVIFWKEEEHIKNAKTWVLDFNMVYIKFFSLIVLICCCVDNTFSYYFIWYMLWSNLFLYSFFHIFYGGTFRCPSKSNGDDKRFIYSILSFLFSLVGMAYLYMFHYETHIDWHGQRDFLHAFGLSVQTAFTFGTPDWYQLDDNKTDFTSLVLFQTLNSFVFISVIIANSIPKSEGK